MSMSGAPRGLGQLQRWMQAVITDPDGVTAGISSEAARQQIDVPVEQVEEVISRSRNQTSIERLSVYAGAYYARLLGCLREEFPALVRVLGEETFNGFAFGYLQAYPPQSYTLTNLGRRFPQFLAETRPAESGDAEARPSWPEFLIDLATVERTYSEVFDGPGMEQRRTLQPEDLTAIPPDRWPDVQLVPVPCLRLLTLRYPVHEYISAVRRNTEAVIPQPGPTHLVVTRREYVVRRHAVSPVEFELLSALVAGETVGRALEYIANRADVDVDELTSSIERWFYQWSAAVLFEAATLTPRS